MRLHYPSFPVDLENAKAQYGKITAGEGVVYSIDIIDNKYTKIDALGNRVWIGYKFSNKAYVNIDYKDDSTKTKRELENEDKISYYERKSINFLILGTRIRKGEKLWGVVYNSGTNEYNLAVHPTHEEAVQFVIQDNYEQLVYKSKYEYAENVLEIDPYERVEFGGIPDDDPGYVKFLRGKGWPYPFTEENYVKYVRENDYWDSDQPRLISDNELNVHFIEQIIEFTVI